MKATIMNPGGAVELAEVPDPTIRRGTDVIVSVVNAAVCGSDLWRYRGETEVTAPTQVGHEFLGVITEVGDDVRSLRKGELVISPFTWSDNTCPECRFGVQSACRNGGHYGALDRDGEPVDGGQGEAVRVPLAEGTLVKVTEYDPEHLPSLLTLADVMGTGWHAAISAKVEPGSVVVVVGDGAVGLCGVLAAASMGAHRIIVMSRNPARQKLAGQFGATEIVDRRGAEGEAVIAELTNGVGADSVLECVGTKQSMDTALAIVRAGGAIGYVGVPHGVELPVPTLFARNIQIAGGVAPARAYLPQLVDKVVNDVIDPGRVFDLQVPLSEVSEAYRAMDERRAVKSLLQVSDL
ncbi:zinc-binding dehydrogenase [Naumannella halotolerans]|uniref:zinc-binding dehydrogenase n=1 Tax=Naumannella halotolerans TaxID=993414 RepID=UPI00370D3BDF